MSSINTLTTQVNKVMNTPVVAMSSPVASASSNSATLPTTSELNNNDDLTMLASVAGGSAIASVLLKFNRKKATK